MGTRKLTQLALIFSFINNSLAIAGPGSSFPSYEPTQEVEVLAPPPPRPEETAVTFSESDFESKAWLRDYEFVVVVNKAESGSEAQTVKIYRRGQLVDMNEIYQHVSRLNADAIQQASMMSINNTDRKSIEETNKRISDRRYHLADLAKRTINNTMFKISTGRDAFEPKGTNHSQRDSWTITPTGYYPVQYLTPKHKSEAYSSVGCDSLVARFFGALFKKEYCTYMEFAMFFNGGIAMHKALPGTEKKLGQKASGGCVRMPGAVAEYLFSTIGATQMANLTKIPMVNRDGSPQMEEGEQVRYIYKLKSVWGQNNVWSALVIVKNEVVQL